MSKSLTGQDILVAIVAAGALLAFSVRADAQIYSWRDANGNLVLSDKRPEGAATVKTYRVPAATDVRTTRAAVATKSRLYDDLIEEYARVNNVRADLVKAVMQVESAFNPFARSARGALGLMQLMPSTIAQFGVRNPFNPVDNIRAGVAYLRQLLDRYDDNEELALAAYNAGPTAVDNHGQAIPPYRETRNYIRRVNRVAGRVVEMPGHIYKVTEVVEGREVVRYTDHKPAAGTYQVVGRR